MNGDFPRVYRLRSGWRNTFVFLGALFAVGGLIGVIFVREMSEFFAGQVVMAVLFLGFALMGAYTVLDMLRTRVVLHADTIELHGAFSKRSLWRPDIAGRRTYSLQHGPPVTSLVPRSESLSRAMAMPQYLESDADFEAWFAAIPDLDAAEADASVKALLEDPTLDGSKEEKLVGLARAHRNAQRLTWVAFGVMAWVWFYPHPYDLAVVCAAILPWVAVAVASRNGSLYKFNAPRNDKRPDITVPLMMPGLGLAIRALFDTHVLDWQDMLLATAAVMSISVLVIWLLARKLVPTAGTAGLLALLMVPYAYGAATLANMQLDHSIPQRFEAQVLGAHVSRGGKSTEYYLTLGPWGPRTEAEDVDVGRSYYQRGSTRKTVCVYLYRGALRIRWFEVWDCPRG